MAISRLSTHVSLSQATVTSILDRLKAEGLVARHRSTMDKRVVHATLTPQGEAIASWLPKPLQDVFSAAFDKLEEWGEVDDCCLLQRVASMMNAEHIDASPMLHVGVADEPAIANGSHPSNNNTNT